MKYSVAVLFLLFLVIRGYSQVHFTRTQVKERKSKNQRMIKTIICTTSDGGDAIFRNWRKSPEAPDDWWLRFEDYSGKIIFEESATHSFWQINLGQTQVTAVKTFGAEGELLGWRLSSRSDTLLLGNFRPDVVDPALLTCSLGKPFPSEIQENDANFSLQKMLIFTQQRRGTAEMKVFESYSVDRCPMEFRVVGAFLATWVLAKELGAY
jgi:hypothetical protein